MFGAIRSEVGTSDNPRKFTGKEYEKDVKLYHFPGRAVGYDPYIGRFNQRDPAGDGANWYAYVGNNPLAFVDPTGLRPVNDREQDALRYTFGNWTGSYLINTIDVEIDASVKGGEVRNNTQVFLNPDYNSENLGWLAVFIHEATHIWQRHTGLHREGRGGEDYVYNASQLITLDLKVEEHASAVQDWFFASYGLREGWIGKFGDEGVQVSFQGAWNHMFMSMGWNDEARSELNLGADHWKGSAYLGGFVNLFYGRVVKEIQNPNLVPPVILGQNFPNAF